MPRMRVTPRKSTRPRPLVMGSIDRFYDLRPEQYFDFSDFLEEFRRAWLAVRHLEVDDFDAIMRLVYVLPAQWQGWAAATALSYIDFAREPEESGDFLGFYTTVRDQNRELQGPPPGDYPPTDFFHLTVRQLFATHYRRREDPPPQPADVVPPQPADVVPPPDIPVPRFDDSMIDDHTSIAPVDIPAPSFYEPMIVDPTPIVPDVDGLDEYYNHPEFDPFFIEMLIAEGIPFPDPDLVVPVVDDDHYDQSSSDYSPINWTDFIDPAFLQMDPIPPITEIVPGEYPVHTVPRDSLPSVPPEPQLFPADYPSHLREVHICQEPPPPVEEGTSSSRQPGLSRSYLYEPELVPTVGSGKLQYLPVSEMSFVTDPYILYPELRVISHDSNPLVPAPPVPHYDEEYIEPLQFATLRHSTPGWVEEEVASQAGDGAEESREDEAGPSGRV